jgi:hypothetical protein
VQMDKVQLSILKTFPVLEHRRRRVRNWAAGA